MSTGAMQEWVNPGIGLEIEVQPSRGFKKNSLDRPKHRGPVRFFPLHDVEKRNDNKHCRQQHRQATPNHGFTYFKAKINEYSGENQVRYQHNQGHLVTCLQNREGKNTKKHSLFPDLQSARIPNDDYGQWGKAVR